MYSAALKQSQVWRSEIGALASPNGLNLRETHFETQDLSIPLRSSPTSHAATGGHARTIAQRTLRVLLLTPSDLSATSLDATTARLTRFAHLTGGVDLVIVFLLQSQTSSLPQPHTNHDKQINTPSPMQAHAILQALILRSPDLRGMPILPIPNTGALVDVLKNYIAAATQATPAHAPKRTIDLLPFCTASAPNKLLSSTTIGVISDMVPDVKILARLACLDMPDGDRDQDVQNAAFRPVDFEMEENTDMVLRRDVDGALREMVSEEERQGVWEFWRGEFAVD